MTDSLQSSESERHLVRLAEKLSASNQYMAGVLGQYCRQEGLDESALADYLKMSVKMYPRLAICKRPTGERPGFAAQVRQISEYVNCDAAQLAHLINQVVALESAPTQITERQVKTSSTRYPEAKAGWLAAARDRTEIEDDSSPGQDRPPDEDVQ